MLDLEKYLHLDQITPMQTSYTQTAEDRKEGDGDDDQSNKGDSNSQKDKESELEPSEDNPDENEDAK